MIVGWAPGGGATDVAGAATALPEGTAIQLKAGSRLVMQVHYSLDNYVAGMMDQTRVDMWFAPREEPLKQAVWIPLLKYDFRVPCQSGRRGPRRNRITACRWRSSGSPRTCIFVDNRSAWRPWNRANPLSCVMNIPRWDFHHQEAYWLKEPIYDLESGRVLQMGQPPRQIERSPLGRRYGRRDVPRLPLYTTL